MKPFWLILFVVGAMFSARAQTNETTLDVTAVLDAAQQWTQENLDEDFLAALPELDRERVETFLNHYAAQLSGDEVLDLAQWRAPATTVLPLLEAHEESQPYAAWLRARLDYFDAVDALRALTPPSTNAVPPPNPSFKTEREVWVKKFTPSPWPKAAVGVVPQLKKIFAEEKVPVELVWLAEVESGFDARARSPAGAVGLFQLMPATARQYGLARWPFDERKQVEPATRAAAKHLRRLYGIFGDWRLAVAAYNCGEGRVQRTLAKRSAKSYERIAQDLPAETQMYVPKVEAKLLQREGKALMRLKVG